MGQAHKEGYLTGKLLLAMPSMKDPRFERAVIYICSHDENGAMGLVINNKLPGMRFKHLLNELKIKSDIEIDPAVLKTPLMNGGPVDTGRGFLLHSPDFKVKESIEMDNAIMISGTIDSLKAMADGKGPTDKLIMFGYAGWSASQVKQETLKRLIFLRYGRIQVVFAVAPMRRVLVRRQRCVWLHFGLRRRRWIQFSQVFHQC